MGCLVMNSDLGRSFRVNNSMDLHLDGVMFTRLTENIKLLPIKAKSLILLSFKTRESILYQCLLAKED